jgi:hypothetical protein
VTEHGHAKAAPISYSASAPAAAVAEGLDVPHSPYLEPAEHLPTLSYSGTASILSYQRAPPYADGTIPMI